MHNQLNTTNTELAKLSVVHTQNELHIAQLDGYIQQLKTKLAQVMDQNNVLQTNQTQTQKELDNLKETYSTSQIQIKVSFFCVKNYLK